MEGEENGWGGGQKDAAPSSVDSALAPETDSSQLFCLCLSVLIFLRLAKPQKHTLLQSLCHFTSLLGLGNEHRVREEEEVSLLGLKACL